MLVQRCPKLLSTHSEVAGKMSCNSAVARDLLKSNTDLDDDQISMNKSKNDGLTEYPEQDTTNDHEKTSLNLVKNMAQSIGMFREYLLTKSQHNMGKIDKEELKAVKRGPCHPCLPSNFVDGFRPLSPLEQKLIPALASGGVLSDDKSSKAQLVMFYSGTISVYEDVPLEKVQAILLLAGESSSTSPAGKSSYTPKLDISKPPQMSNLPSICKLQADLPIARKYSLQRFLQKRRDRITNKCPYAPPPSKKLEEDHESSSNDLCVNSLDVLD